MTGNLSPRSTTAGLGAARDTPWKAVNEIRRLAASPWTRTYFAIHGVRWRRGWRIYGTPLIQRHRGSRITAGDDLELRSWFSSNPLGVRQRCILATWSADAVVEIGAGVGMSGATVCAQTRIAIGDRVMVGAGTTIVDTDFHPVSAADRRAGPGDGRSEAIEIGADCFIGMHAIILKGARIGDGAAIGAGSVVTGRVDAGTVVAGNPARVIAIATDGG
jgi:carbonic anhydrase/acetyltransferase-like protein (isoleucine patch superfamily)